MGSGIVDVFDGLLRDFREIAEEDGGVLEQLIVWSLRHRLQFQVLQSSTVNC